MRRTWPRGPGVNVPWNHADVVGAGWYSTATGALACAWACDFKYTHDAFVPMAWALRAGGWPRLFQYARHPNRREHLVLLWNEPNVPGQSDATPQACADTIRYFDAQTDCSWAGPIVLWHYGGEDWLDAYFAEGGRRGTLFAVDVYAVSVEHFREQWTQIRQATARWWGGSVAIVIQEFGHLYYPSQLASGTVSLQDVEDMQMRLVDEVFALAEQDGQLYGWGYFSAHYSSYDSYYRPLDLLDAAGNVTRVGRHWNMRAQDYLARHDYLPVVLV